MMLLDFKNNDEILTLGAEMEVQLLDQKTLRLSPKAPDILHELQHEKLTKEMFRSTLECITGVCRNVHEITNDLEVTLVDVKRACHKNHLYLAGTGTHPLADYKNRILSKSSRYHELLDRNQWLIRRMAVYGLHVHIGMADGDACIRYNNFFLHFLPHLIALSASSPFWKGRDTGLNASRPTTYEAHPTSGLPIVVETWKEFNTLYSQLIHTRSIQSMKDIWWDLRPSPGFGTLEIRICDGPASLLELSSMVAWIHLLAHWYRDHAEEFASKNNLKPTEWVMRENKWRAIRHGIQADIVSHETLSSISLAENIHYWIERLEPYSSMLGYEPYLQCIRDIMSKGNSAQRQRNVFARTGDIYEVVRHNIKEFTQGTPNWS